MLFSEAKKMTLTREREERKPGDLERKEVSLKPPGKKGNF